MANPQLEGILIPMPTLFHEDGANTWVICSAIEKFNWLAYLMRFTSLILHHWPGLASFQLGFSI
jgi:hypothetical protein